MKTLTLDYSIWRCGNNGEYHLGLGTTAMENSQGFQCCLGQFSKQLNKNITRDIILGVEVPSEVCIRIPFLNKSKNIYINTKLASRGIRINDNPTSTPEEKILSLRKLFKRYGFKIRVINKPKKK
jgi:hypothetical protein